MSSYSCWKCMIIVMNGYEYDLGWLWKKDVKFPSHYLPGCTKESCGEISCDSWIMNWNHSTHIHRVDVTFAKRFLFASTQQII